MSALKRDLIRRKVRKLQKAGDWSRLTRLMVDAALKVEGAGADFLIICANTMHRTAEAIQAATAVPLIHIADAAAAAVRKAGLKTVGLLGTRYTMELDFYRLRLEKKHGLKIIVPNEPDRTCVHDIIYSELTTGLIRDASRIEYLAIIERLRARGAEGVILGCTEIPLLVKPGDASLPLFDTTALHAEAAVDAAFND